MAYMVTTTTPSQTERANRIRFVFKLTMAQALLLDMLLTEPVVSADGLVARGIAPTNNSVRTVVTRIRKFLSKRNMKLPNQYGLGYSLADDCKKKLLNELYPGR